MTPNESDKIGKVIERISSKIVIPFAGSALLKIIGTIGNCLRSNNKMVAITKDGTDTPITATMVLKMIPELVAIQSG